MKNFILPVKNWNENARKADDYDESMALLWAKYIGNENEKETKESGSKVSSGTVSIRCRRHKRRFNVPSSWLETCEWLCPKCYKKLSSSEREKYAPRRQPNKSENPNTEQAKREYSEHLETADEAHKTSVGKTINGEAIVQKAKKLASLMKLPYGAMAIKDTEVEMDCIYCGDKPIVPKAHYYADHFFCPECSSHLDEGGKRRFKKSFMVTQARRFEEIETKFLKLVREEADKGKAHSERAERDIRGQKKEDKKPSKKEPVKRSGGDNAVSCIGLSDSFMSLLPRFRIKCKKCHATVPCHKSWFANSRVLCPSCFSSMTTDEVRAFHTLHPEETAETFEVESLKLLKTRPNTKRVMPNVAGVSVPTVSKPIQSPGQWSTLGGACSEKFIMHASRQELLRAVREGRLSKARARIEFNRRKNASYFNSLPDAHVNIVSF